MKSTLLPRFIASAAIRHLPPRAVDHQRKDDRGLHARGRADGGFLERELASPKLFSPAIGLSDEIDDSLAADQVPPSQSGSERTPRGRRFD